jgi:hypothetical protein
MATFKVYASGSPPEGTMGTICIPLKKIDCAKMKWFETKFSKTDVCVIINCDLIIETCPVSLKYISLQKSHLVQWNFDLLSTTSLPKAF